MSDRSADTGGSRPQWPAATLTALRLGRRLVAEVPASGPGRRAFVEIRPVTTTADSDAHRQQWTRSDRDRTFTIEQWDYDGDRLTGFDYDIGAVLVRAVTVTGEAPLLAAVETWNLPPEQFRHPWQIDDPR